MRQLLNLALTQFRYLYWFLVKPRAARAYWSHLYYESRRADRWIQPRLHYRLPVKSADDVFTGITRQSFSLAEFHNEYGGVSLDEVRILAASIKLLVPRMLFEFGTFNGMSTLQLAANVQPDAVIHTIDLPEDHPLRQDVANVDVVPAGVGGCFRGTSLADRICQHFGDSLTYDFSEFYGRCDWIFVDAAHSYEFVLSDTNNALKMLRPGGVIFWHDVNAKFAGVCRVLEELAKSLPVQQIEGTSLACFRSSPDYGSRMKVEARVEAK